MTLAPLLRVVQGLAGVHPPRLPPQLLYDQGRGVERHLQAAQAAGLSLQLGALSVVVRHRHVAVGSWFGEAPDEDAGHGGAAVQRDRAPHGRRDVGADVLHLLGVEYLQSLKHKEAGVSHVLLSEHRPNLRLQVTCGQVHVPVSSRNFYQSSQFTGNRLRQLSKMNNLIN